MDDYSFNNLQESRNEYTILLVNLLSPFIVEGFTSIIHESIKLCNANNESTKYLMTAQNFISRIPKWNNAMVETECTRIREKSTHSGYLEDLISCVHIIHLKIMTLARVGQKQKQIDIDIPKLDVFVHAIYINVARKIYKNMYLFEVGIPALQIQKNNREFEILVNESIMKTIRDNIPVTSILHAYLNEGTETTVSDDIKEEIVYEDIKQLEEPQIIPDPSQDEQPINSPNSSSTQLEKEQVPIVEELPSPSIQFADEITDVPQSEHYDTIEEPLADDSPLPKNLNFQELMNSSADQSTDNLLLMGDVEMI
jgi:hypothetical protein